MTCKINASTTGSGGLLLESDSSGALDLQSNGVTKVSFDTSGNMTTQGTIPAGALTGNVSSSLLSGNLPALNASSLTNIPAANITGTLPALDGSNLTGVAGGKFTGTAAGILTTSTVGIQTANVTAPDLVGAASSMVGMYIGDGHLLFSNYLNKSGGYYISTGLNALNAGPVTLATPMTLDGTWTIV